MHTLTSTMDNCFAWRLGEVARKAGDPNRTDVGDFIDRGLILRRLLEEEGFLLILKQTDAYQCSGVMTKLERLIRSWRNRADSMSSNSSYAKQAAITYTDCADQLEAVCGIIDHVDNFTKPY